MQHRFLLWLLALWPLAIAFDAASADLPSNVLVRSRWIDLTRADYDAALSRIPENLRYDFATSPKRVEGLLNNILQTKTLAAQARAHGTVTPLAVQEPAAADDDR